MKIHYSMLDLIQFHPGQCISPVTKSGIQQSYYVIAELLVQRWHTAWAGNPDARLRQHDCLKKIERKFHPDLSLSAVRREANRHHTCVASGAASVLLAVVVPVLSGEHHPRLIAHGVGQVSDCPLEVDDVVVFGSAQAEVVLYEAPAQLPVVHIDAEDGVAAGNQSTHLLEAEPKLTWENRRWGVTGLVVVLKFRGSDI